MTAHAIHELAVFSIPDAAFFVGGCGEDPLIVGCPPHVKHRSIVRRKGYEITFLIGYFSRKGRAKPNAPGVVSCSKTKPFWLTTAKMLPSR